MPTPADWRQMQNNILANYKKCTDQFGREYDSLFCQLVWTETATSLQDFSTWVDKLKDSQKRWSFRGQRESAWALQTSLGRILKPYWLPSETLPETETNLLLKFKEGSGPFITNPPSDKDVSSWLALMQHYGIPTNLLDCTWSPDVALYFAMEEKPTEKEYRDTDDSRYSAVWAINMDWMDEKNPTGIERVSVNEYVERCNDVVSQNNKPSIVSLNPPKPNMRMVRQKGFFLRKQYDRTPYLDQIFISMMTDPIQDQPVIRKLKIDKALRIECLNHLRKKDIHSASLFPDREGFCESLKTDLELELAGGAK